MTTSVLQASDVTEISIKHMPSSSGARMIQISVNAELHTREDHPRFERDRNKFKPVHSDSCLVPVFVRGLFADYGLGVNSIRVETNQFVVRYGNSSVVLDEFEDALEKILMDEGFDFKISLS